MASVEIVQTARKMGYFTVVTDNLAPEYSDAKRVADEYWMISTGDTDALEQKCREEGIGAVFAGVSEFNLDQVKELTKRLGLPCYIEDSSWKYARDKSAFKAKCREVGIPVVEEYTLSDPPKEQELAGIEYPVVVKPVDGTGNKGLSICYNDAELIKGCEKARNNSQSRHILVERYVKGEETWRHYYLADNEIRFVYGGRAFRQPGYPTFLYLCGDSSVGDFQEYKEQLDQHCIDFLRAIGCTRGIAWFQFLKDEKGRYYALEMAQRLSADNSGVSIEKACGVNAMEWLLDTAFGVEHKASMLPETTKPPYKTVHCVYYQFADRAGKICSMEGYNELDPDQFQVSFLAHEGTDVDQYRMITKIVFNADNGKEMCEKIRYINDHVRVLDEQGGNMYIMYTDYDYLLEAHKGLFLNE